MKYPGFFIAFEGCDGSGKTTQVNRLGINLILAGITPANVFEPGCSQIGTKIRALFKDPTNKMCMKTELFLLLASRAQLVTETIIPYLKDGRVVIADRFFDSTMVYQGLVGGLRPSDVSLANSICTEDEEGNPLIPDLTIFIDVTFNVAMARMKVRNEAKDRIEARGEDYLSTVHAAYRQQCCGPYSKEKKRVTVLGDGREEDVAKLIKQIVFNELKERAYKI